MEGWYVADQDESQFPVSTGRLNIRVTNLPEFRLEAMGYIRKQQDAPRTMWIKGIKVIVDEKENILQDMPVLRRTSGSE